jgi:hypothetical protein
MGLLGSGVICGTLLALDRFDADARSRDTVQLLELLDAAPVPGGTHQVNVPSSEAIRPSSKLVQSIRVGLLSRSPIQSLRASPTTTCRRADGSFIAVNQLSRTPLNPQTPFGVARGE